MTFWVVNTSWFSGLKYYSMYMFLIGKYAVVHWLKMLQYVYFQVGNTPLFTDWLKMLEYVYVFDRKYAVVNWLKLLQYVFF